MEEVKGRGRPAGSKNKPRDEVEVFISACKTCGSTKRTKYTNTQTADIEGETLDGRRYNQVTWRNTNCLKCGQARVDRFYEMVETVDLDEDKNEQSQEESKETSSSKAESNANDIFGSCIGANQANDLIHEPDGNTNEDSEPSSDP